MDCWFVCAVPDITQTAEVNLLNFIMHCDDGDSFCIFVEINRYFNVYLNKVNDLRVWSCLLIFKK